MADTASLSLRIDSTEAIEAAAALERLQTAGKGAEGAASGVGRSFTTLGASMGQSANFTAKIGSEFQKLNAATTSIRVTLPQVAQAVNTTARAQDSLAASTRNLLTVEERRQKALALTAGTAEQQAQQASRAAAFMAQQSAAANAGWKALDKYGQSAKQTAFAMRLLPMQMTDIVTSLSSGMPVWQVAIQQGGQIRDSFGGISNAFKAVLEFIGPVRLAIGGVVGVLTGLAVAYAKGSAEQDAFNKALILTGNYAGTTAGQLATMAQNIDGVVGTQAKAAKALAALAGTGQIAAGNLEEFATVAVRMEREVGQSVEKTAKKFAELARSPVSASLRLNEEIRHLTLTLYEEIKALDDAGRSTEAAELAMKAYADAMNDRTGQINDNLSYIERAWRAIKDGAAEAWDAMLGIGRQVTPEAALEAARTKVRELESQGKWGITWGHKEALAQARTELELAERRAQQGQDLARVQGEYQRRQQEGITASREIEKWREKGLTNQQKITRELDKYHANIQKIRAAGGVVSDEEVRRTEKAIRDQFKDRSSSSSRSFRDDAATRMIQQSREMQATLRAQIAGEDKLGAAARARVEFEQMVVDLKEKKVLTATQKEILAGEERIRTELKVAEALEQQFQTVEKRIKAEEEARRQKERFDDRAQQLREQVAGRNALRREEFDLELAGAGMGDQALGRMREEMGLRREFAAAQARLAIDAARTGQLGSESYRAEVAEIDALLDEALADHADYYAKLKKLQGDWRVGASAALQSYLEEAENVAAQTNRAIGDGLHVLEDGFAGVMDGNYKSFRDFADSMEREFMAIVNRMIAKALTAELGKKLMGDSGGMGSGGGGMGGIFGSIFGSMLGGGSGIGYGTAGTAATTAMVPDIAGNLIAAIADGAAFGPSGIEKFADGGVVRKPTFFRYAGGKTGLMGEAGEEGIFPLARMRDGKLGVKAQGGGGGGIVNHVQMTVVTPDAESFRRSETQIMGRLGSGLARGRRGQ